MYFYVDCLCGCCIPFLPLCVLFLPSSLITSLSPPLHFIHSVFEISTALAAAHGMAWLFVPLAAAGASLHSVAHLAWEATHANFIRGLSQRNNIADVTAKADSQMVVAELIGLGLGVGLIGVWHDPVHLFIIFALAAPVHFGCTIQRLRSIRFGMVRLQSNLRHVPPYMCSYSHSTVTPHLFCLLFSFFPLFACTV